MALLDIPPEALGIGSGWMLTGLAVWMVLTGRLVPKSVVDRLERDHQREIDQSRHEANEWRTEGRIKDQQNAELTDSLRTLGNEMAPLVETTMRAIQKQSGRSGPEEP